MKGKGGLGYRCFDLVTSSSSSVVVVVVVASNHVD
jgi:hypothetical protein